jgi:S-adenosylhomocysteine hydrolase
VDGVPVFPGQSVVVQAQRDAQVLPARHTPAASDYAHVNELIPGGTHVRRQQEGDRAATNGLWMKNARDIGRRPVLPIEPTPDGLYLRDSPDDAVWTGRLMSNWPLLYPEHYLSLKDITGGRLHRYGAVPLVARLVDEIVAAVPDLTRREPAREPALSPLAAALLAQLRRVNDQSAVPFVAARDTSVLQTPDGGLLDATLIRMAVGGGCMNILKRDSMQEKWGDLGGALFDAWMQAAPRPRGLQRVLDQAFLPMEPTYANQPPTREEVEVTRAKDPALLDAMVEYAALPERLPHVDAAAELVPDGTFAGVHLVAVQHVMATHSVLLRAMEKKGLDPAQSEIVGVPYSTSYVVEHAIRRRGYRIHTPDIVDPSELNATMDAAIVAALRRAIEAAKRDGKPILALDDGGKMSLAIHRHFPDDVHRFRVVEQTTRGITEVRSLAEVKTPVVGVAMSPLKRFERDKVGLDALANIERLLARLNLPAVAGKHVTVLGYGTIGQGIARALRAAGALVTVYDVDPVKQALAAEHGFGVPRDRAEALGGKHLIVGCTGHRSITRDDLALLSHETVLASASSRDVEIDLSPNRDRDVECVPLLAEGPGDRRFITRVWRLPDKDVVVLRNGFPVNFAGALENGSYESIQQTQAILLLGCAQALTTDAAGLVPLAPELEKRFAERAGIH